MVANVIGVKKPAMDGNEIVVETLAQNWSSMGRKRQYELVDCHQRTYAQLEGSQRNLCEGLEMPRSSMVEVETTSLE